MYINASVHTLTIGYRFQSWESLRDEDWSAQIPPFALGFTAALRPQAQDIDHVDQSVQHPGLDASVPRDVPGCMTTIY